MPLSLVCYLHHVCINFCLYLQMIWYLNLDGQAGNPVYMSWPHFLHGDSILTEAVDGLTPPDVDNHSFVLDIQPEWGITLSAKARFQFNVLVEPSQEWPWMANVKDKVRTRLWPHFQYLIMLFFRWCYLSSCWTRGCPNPMTSSWVRCTWWRARQTRWRTWLCWSEPPSPSSAWLRRSSYGRGLAVGNPRDSVSSF